MENNWTNEAILSAIQGQFGASVIAHDEAYDMLNIEVNPSDAHAIIKWVKEHPEMKVNFLTNLTGIHYPDQKGREICVVYHMHSWTNNVRFRLKAYLPIAQPNIQSITDLFIGANWLERETFDFFGIIFDGHPDLRRILNMDEMDYHPLRKEYHLEDQTRQDKDNRYFGR